MSDRSISKRVTYSDELAVEIASLYTQGHSWRAIAAMDGMPARSNMERWREEHDTFRALIARAARARAADAASEAGRVLDECDPDEGDPRTASSRVALANYKSQYRKWLASRLDPDAFGDRARTDLKAEVKVLSAFVDVASVVEAQAAARGPDGDDEPPLPHCPVPDGLDMMEGRDRPVE